MENLPLSESSSDVPESVSLKTIVQSFRIGINEEQAWAILHQTAVFLKSTVELEGQVSGNSGATGSGNMTSFATFPDIANLFMGKDGSVVVKMDAEKSENQGPLSQEACLQHLAFAIFEACEFGLSEEQEANLSTDLASLLENMANCEGLTDRSDSSRSEPVDWIEPGNGSEEDDSPANSSQQPFSNSVNNLPPVDLVIQKSVHRNKDPSDAANHYQAVCRALVVECCDLMEFLKRVQSKASVKKNNGKASGALAEWDGELFADEFRDWAKLWMQVVGTLREGVKLRNVSAEMACRVPTVYELTPYEMLMEDIRLRRFSLKNTMVNDDLPVRAKLDAHDIILEYIRSRPPLLAAEKRVLRPRCEQHNPMEILMNSIREFQFATLRRATTQKQPKEPSSPLEKSALGQMDTKSVAAQDLSPNSATGGLPKRRLVIPDAETSHPVDFLNSEAPDDSDRFSQTGQEPVDMDDEFYSSEMGHVGENVESNVSRSKRSYSDVVSLTLDEVALIRGALAKAELDNLEEQDLRLYNAIRRSKICFTCKRVKFSWLFREVGVKCHLCQNTICVSCARQMILPCDRLDRIPVHTLSPTMEQKDNEPVYANLINKRPAMCSSTMPRQRLQRSLTHDVFVSSTLPKKQTRQRPPLHRGLTVAVALPSPVIDRQRRPSFPSSEAIIVQVCTDCHSVLYHAIVESQTQLASICPAKSTNPNLDPFRQTKALTCGRDSHSVVSEGSTRRTPSYTQFDGASVNFHNSSSSVISDSQSDSLDEDFNGDDLTDFLEGSQMTDAATQRDVGGNSVSPGVSRSDSTSSEAGSFYSNHI